TEDPTQYTLDNVANAPTPAGYVWVVDADGDQPYLVKYERDDTGQLRVPEGTLLVGGNVRASTNPFDGPDWLERFAENPNDVLGEWASGGWDWLTGAISGGWDKVREAVPEGFKDWWDDNIQAVWDAAVGSGFLDFYADWLREEIPIVGDWIAGMMEDETNRALVSQLLEDPGVGILQIVGASGHGTVMNLIDHEINKLTGEEDSGFGDRVGQIASIAAENTPF